MSRDRLLPDVFSRVHKRYQTPHVSTWLAGLAEDAAGTRARVPGAAVTGDGT